MKILDTGKALPEENMAIDTQLLQESTEPVLHLYDWVVPSATYGHFINPSDYLNVESDLLRLAKRPTGGGIIFHTCDIAFSVFIPADHPGFSVNTLENYAYINNQIVEVIQKFLGREPGLLHSEPIPLDEASRHFCMAKPTVYDVMLDGKKVGGAAQRRTKRGYLHQGSIALTIPTSDFLEKVLLPNTAVKESMYEHSFPLLGTKASERQLEEARSEIQELLIKFL